MDTDQTPNKNPIPPNRPEPPTVGVPAQFANPASSPSRAYPTPSPQPPASTFTASPLPQQNPISPVNSAENKSGAVGLVLQWLSYGLWEWTFIALSILLSSTLTYYFIQATRSENYSWLVYVVASTLVLLPIAFVMDKLYSKHEPLHKHGFAAVIMVINAVLVFLSFIGGLITCVVSALSLMVSAGTSSNKYIVVVSSLVVATLSLLLFLRIMNFEKLQKFNRLFPIIAVIIAGMTAVAALAGPFRAEVGLKNDRLIEDNISSVNSAIQDYARKNNKLPASLNDLDFNSSYEQDARQLTTSGLLTYSKITTTSHDSTQGTTASGATITRSLTPASQSYRYELCATYKKERKSGGSYDSLNNDSSIDANNHKAGKQCYTQTTIVYNDNYDNNH